MGKKQNNVVDLSNQGGGFGGLGGVPGGAIPVNGAVSPLGNAVASAGPGFGSGFDSNSCFGGGCSGGGFGGFQQGYGGGCNMNPGIQVGGSPFSAGSTAQVTVNSPFRLFT